MNDRPRPTLATTLSRVSDAGKEIETRLGLRPFRVFLVWARWSGLERGEGTRTVVAQCELSPRPSVSELTGVRKGRGGAGNFGEGSIRVSGISARYTNEQLQGMVVPDREEDQVPQPYEFFWEVVEDGRHGPAPVRRRFILPSEPSLDPIEGWTADLEREDDSRNPDGTLNDDPVPDPVDRGRAKPVPPDDDDL